MSEFENIEIEEDVLRIVAERVTRKLSPASKSQLDLAAEDLDDLYRSVGLAFINEGVIESITALLEEIERT